MEKLLRNFQDNWPTYLFDVLVLILGVYGAFTMENWREQRGEQEFEAKILQELVVSLQRDVRDLEFNIDVHEKSLASQQIILKWLSSEGGPSESICLDFAKSTYWTVFISYSGTYQTIKNRGISMIRDDELRMALLGLYETTYDYHDEVEQLYNKRVEHIWQELDSQYFMNSGIDDSSPDLVKCQKPIDDDLLHGSTEYRVHLDGLREWNEHFIGIMRSARDKANAIIDQIRTSGHSS